ncbi:MAG: BRO family protein [Desulfuromonadales bacterium]
MTDRSLPVSGSVTFEELEKTNEHGAEFWSARELQPLLGYGQWRRFEDAINRAMTSCGQSGNNPDYHFVGAGKMIATGKGALREVSDFHLSRFACYLIAQNGDPRKPEIAEYETKMIPRQILREKLHEWRELLEARPMVEEGLIGTDGE